jgi:hypothetical protein
LAGILGCKILSKRKEAYVFSPKKRQIGPEQAQGLAVQALQFLAQDEDRLNAFLTNTGLGIENLREAAGSPQFFGALLDHIIGDDALVLGLAAEANVAPENVVAAAEYFRRDEF